MGSNPARAMNFFPIFETFISVLAGLVAGSLILMFECRCQHSSDSLPYTITINNSSLKKLRETSTPLPHT